MSDELTYWRCPDCRGSGNVLAPLGTMAMPCRRCAGTGNALKGAEPPARRKAREIRSRALTPEEE